MAEVGCKTMVQTSSRQKVFISNIQTIMRIKKGFVLREVCGENVIMGEGLGAINFGKMLTLNKTAAWLWKQAEAMGDFTIEALTDRLCDEYEVTPNEAKADVTAIVAEWQKVNVIE